MESKEPLNIELPVVIAKPPEIAKPPATENQHAESQSSALLESASTTQPNAVAVVDESKDHNEEV